MAVSSYPSVLLLDDLNNPITPLVDIDSIYTDASTKASVSVISQVDISKIDDSNKINVNSTSGEITISDDNFPSSGIVSIITDIRIGDSVTISGNTYPSHTLKIQKVDLNKLMTKWYEDEYMRNRLGYEVWYGNYQSKPDSYNSSNRTVTFANGDTISIEDDRFKHSVDGSSRTYKNHMWRINDYNSTNFFSTDDGKFPRRGKVYPSNEYIWFLIIPDATSQQSIKTDTIKLYGASGEDSPQEIEIENVNSNLWLYSSKSTFGIDSELNGNAVYNDGFEYNIYLKYKLVNE